MHVRWWLYMTAIIVGLILLFTGIFERNHIENKLAVSQSQRNHQTKNELARYLVKQTNPYKLVSLAILLKHSDNSILEPIIDRAYALAPDDASILILDSQFHPELKSKIAIIDPLYPNN